jgi:hypothetical protein
MRLIWRCHPALGSSQDELERGGGLGWSLLALQLLGQCQHCGMDRRPLLQQSITLRRTRRSLPALGVEFGELAAQFGQALVAGVHTGQGNPLQYWSPGVGFSGDAARQDACVTWWPPEAASHSRRQGVVPASSRATREATSFSSGETLAAAAPWADREERDGEATATDGQAQDLSSAGAASGKGRPWRSVNPVPPASHRQWWAGLRSPCAAAHAEDPCATTYWGFRGNLIPRQASARRVSGP